MTLERMIADLGVRVAPDELARIVKGAEDDIAAARRLRDWLAAQQRT